MHMAARVNSWHADGILKKATASERSQGAQLGEAAIGVRQPALGKGAQ